MIEFDKLCKSCMTEIGEEKICPYCGYNQDERQPAPYLPKGSLLENRYAIGRYISQSPEGVSYIAYDLINKQPVHVHEYLPADFCVRLEGETAVRIIKGYDNSFYTFEDNFLKYFRTLARLRSLSGIVPIFNIFLQNNTAYVVSEWVSGISLTKFVERNGGSINWETARPLFMPLVSSLTQIHSSGVSHYNISPDNLLITNSGKMKLVDFSIPDIRNKNSQISSELDDGCTALEQYIEELPLGETTDVYGFATSIFFALTGSYPKKATERQQDDKLYISKTLLKAIPSYVVNALANALQVDPEKRTLSFERFRAEISAAPTVINELDSDFNNDKDISDEKQGMSNFMIGMISCSIALIVFLIIGSFCYFYNSFNTGIKMSSSLDNDSSYSVITIDESISETLNAPNLVGKNYREIHDNIKSTDNYSVALLTEEFSDSVKEGYIISQTPSAGTSMASDTVIMLTVSKGSKARSLPDITGLSLSEASLKLTSSGFKPVQLQENSNSVESGYVIGYKDNKAGAKLDYGSEVYIVVSIGPS